MGVLTDKKILKGLIKETWRETVYERDDFWAVSVTRNEVLNEQTSHRMEDEFKDFLMELKDAFQGNVEGVDTEDTAGTYFIVYLKKNSAIREWTEKDQKGLDEFYEKYKNYNL